MLEAFAYAKREVATAYEREGIMSTEHALLNDSGGEGIPNPAPDGKQGKVAAVLSLGSAAASGSAAGRSEAARAVPASGAISSGGSRR